MKTIKIAKADPIDPSLNAQESITPVTIVINDKIPNSDYPVFDVESYYYDQADLLADALFKALPQGTLDRLLVTLMKRKVSLYRGLTK